MSFHNSLGMSNEGREVIDLLLLSNEIVFKSSSCKIVSQQEYGYKNSIHITMAMVQFITDNLQSVLVWWAWLPAQMCADVRESPVIVQNMMVDNYR